MKFVEKKENRENFYLVDYNKDELKRILEELEDYGYIRLGKMQVAGEITRWPATKNNIRKRTIESFYSRRANEGKTIYPETIVHHTEDECDYITYDYSYKKLPDLYDYIDIIINDKDVVNYHHLFARITEERTGSLNMFYAVANRDQLVLEGILNYVNSPELTKHTPVKDEKEYNYKGLNELYKKTLKCFNFSLIAIKEYLKEPEQVDILKLQLRK